MPIAINMCKNGESCLKVDFLFFIDLLSHPSTFKAQGAGV